MQVERSILWSRIQDRLAREPERVKYNEGSFEWMEKTQDFYEHFDWDMTVENNHNSLDEVTRSLLETLEARVPQFDSPSRKKVSCSQESRQSDLPHSQHQSQRQTEDCSVVVTVDPVPL